MNTSAALRLLAAANDDAVLASWAAVFDEHKMAPECDVSPYDCWEILQGFLSSGVVSQFEYDSVNLKAAFFNGGRPSTGAIQEVLGRLAYLRANHPIEKEVPMSTARPPMSAFAVSPAHDENRSISTSTPRALGNARPNPGLAAFQAPTPMAAFGAAAPMRPLAEPPAPRAFAAPTPSAELSCRKVDASLYRGVGQFDVQLFCCNQQLIIEDISEDEPFAGELEDGTDGVLHEFMFHAHCPSCGARFHSSMARKVPELGY